MTAIHLFLSDRSRAAILGFGVLLSVLIAVGQQASGMSATLWVLACVPIAMVTVYAGWHWGAVIALLAVLLPVSSLINGLLALPTPASGGAEFVGRLAILAGFIAVVAGLHATAGVTAEPITPEASLGLLSSREFFDRLGHEVERSRRYGRFFTVAYVGIDNLTALRQRQGGAAAQAALRKVDQILTHTLRAVDVVGRLRDREIGILMVETGSEDARAALERVRANLREALPANVQLSFSIGAVTWVNSELSVQALHQRTYQLMYSARRENTGLKHEVRDVHTDASERIWFSGVAPAREGERVDRFA